MNKELSLSEREELIKLIQQLEYNQRYNKLSSFRPYPFQEQFYSAGANVKRRFLCAANRIGKSFSESMEMAMHLTGRYPKDWKGHKFTKPILGWAVGITGDSTRKVLQKELFGTPLGKDNETIGTGSIPRDCIDFEYLEKDGHLIRNCKVKWHDEDGNHKGYSTLEFRSTQQGEHVLMGATVDFIWLDEEDPYKSTKIYSQCVTRTATTGGHVVITATPENGLTELVDMFMTNEDGDLYWQNATWDDAPHLSEEAKRELLASIPVWQHDMRARGIPLSGEGIVFPISQDRIVTDPLDIDNWDSILWSLDITHKGKEGNDPTVLSLCVKKGADDYYIAHQETFMTGGDERAVAAYLSTHIYKNAPVIIPHDAGGAEGYGAVLKGLGANVQPETFFNPAQILSSMGTNSVKPKPNDIDNGLHALNDLLDKGQLKIDRRCSNLLREITTYSRTGKKGEGAFRGKDDHIDSFRYGIVSLIGHRGIPAGQAQLRDDEEDWNNGFTPYEDEVTQYIYN
ncbi:terminase family protein [Vibrio breoganii]